MSDIEMLASALENDANRLGLPRMERNMLNAASELRRLDALCKALSAKLAEPLDAD